MQYSGGGAYSKILELNRSCHYSFTKKARHATGTDGQPASLMISLSLFFPLQGSRSEGSGDNSQRSKQNIKTQEEDLFQAKSENTSLNVPERLFPRQPRSLLWTTCSTKAGAETACRLWRSRAGKSSANGAAAAPPSLAAPLRQVRHQVGAFETFTVLYFSACLMNMRTMI